MTLAFIDLEAQTGPHGHPMWEATDPTAVDPDGEYRYVAGEPVTDYAARVQAAAEKDLRDKGEDLTGVYVPVRKVMARTD